MTDIREVHKFYEELINRFNPKDKEDYIKILSLGMGTRVWNNNQDTLFDSGLIDFKDIISNREELYDYLINHNIDSKLALDITTFVRKGRAFSDFDVINNCSDLRMKKIWADPNRIKEWEKYQSLMNDKKCDDWIIDICSKIIFLPEKNMAIQEYLRITNNDTIPFNLNNI